MLAEVAPPQSLARPATPLLTNAPTLAMVKFAKRLEEELIKSGWDEHYVQYKPLKKIINAAAKHEVAGEMVQVHIPLPPYPKSRGTPLPTRAKKLKSCEACIGHEVEISDGHLHGTRNVI